MIEIRKVSKFAIQNFGIPLQFGTLFKDSITIFVFPSQNPSLQNPNLFLTVSITRHSRSGDNKGLHGMKLGPGPRVWAAWHSVSSLFTRPAVSQPSWLPNSKETSAVVPGRLLVLVSSLWSLGCSAGGVLGRAMHSVSMTRGVERHRRRRAWKRENLGGWGWEKDILRIREV